MGVVAPLVWSPGSDDILLSKRVSVGMVWASSISEEAPQEEYQGLSWVKISGNMWITQVALKVLQVTLSCRFYH